MAKPIGYAGRYYPGEKFPTARAGRPIPYIPNEYDLNAFNEAIQSMALNFGDIPRFIADQLDVGIKLQLSARLYANHLGAEDLYAYSEAELTEERGEISGISGISISLDPRDIAKDPKKWLSKIPKEAWKELTDWSDIELKKRELLWASILGVEKHDEADYRLMGGLQEQEIYMRAGETWSPRGGLQIGELKVGGDAGIDIGKAAAIAIVDFQSDIKTAFYRDRNFDTVMRATFSGASKALEGAITNGIQTPAGTVKIVNPGTQWGDASIAASFMGKVTLADHVGNFKSNTKSNTSSLENVIARLNLEASPLDKDGDPLRLEVTIEAMKKDIEKARAHMQLLQGGVASLSASERAALGDKKVDFYGNITQGPILGMGEIKQLEPQIRRFQKALAELEGAIGGPLPANWLERNKLLQQVSAITMDLGGGTFIEHGVEREILRQVADTFVGGHKVSVADVRRLEEMFPQGSQERTYFRNLRVLLPTLERDRFFFGMDDFVQTFYDDKVLGAFLWVAKINPRLKAFTPDHYIELFMDRMNYFGLKIREGTLVDELGNVVNPKFFMYRWMNKLIQNKDGSAKKLFSNTFSISVKSVGLETTKMATSGGAHFTAIKDLFELFNEDQNRALLLELLQNPDKAEEIIKRFAGANPDWFKKMFGNAEDPTKAMEKWAKKFGKNFKKFHDWLNDNLSKLNPGFDIKNPDHVFGLIKGLHQYDVNKIKNIGIGITKEFRGIMQTLAQKLSVLQNEIFKGILGKVVAAAIGWKMVVSHAVATAITGALAALTGGLGTFVAGAVEKVVQFVARIALDLGEKVIGSILKGDFKQFYIFMEKSMYNMLKWFSYAMGAIGIVAAICMLPILVILGAFSSQDNSKIGDIGGGPSGETGYVGPGAPEDLPDITPGTCFFETGGYLSHPSFGRISTNRGDGFASGCASYDYYGHGTRDYGYCFNIPWVFVVSNSSPPRGPNAYPGCSSCGAVTTECTNCPNNNAAIYFGYAADFSSRRTADVRLPTIGAPDVAGGDVWTWYVAAMGDMGSSGQWVDVRRTDADGHQYYMDILHINRSASIQVGQELPAGRFLGTLYRLSGSGMHVHVELSYNGTVVRPDYLFCTENVSYW